MNNELKPSDFQVRPFDSVFKKSEHETVARNIMVILKRTGNEWRELTQDEYIKQRQKDGNYTPRELEFFNDVVPYTKSVDTARLFSPTWRDVEKAEA